MFLCESLSRSATFSSVVLKSASGPGGYFCHSSSYVWSRNASSCSMGKRACLAFSVACCEADDVTGPSEGDPMPLRVGLEGSDEVGVTVYELLAESIFFEAFLVVPAPRLPAGGGPSTITLVLEARG